VGTTTPLSTDDWMWEQVFTKIKHPNSCFAWGQVIKCDNKLPEQGCAEFGILLVKLFSTMAPRPFLLGAF